MLGDFWDRYPESVCGVGSNVCYINSVVGSQVQSRIFVLKGRENPRTKGKREPKNLTGNIKREEETREPHSMNKWYCHAALVMGPMQFCFLFLQQQPRRSVSVFFYRDHSFPLLLNSSSSNQFFFDGHEEMLSGWLEAHRQETRSVPFLVLLVFRLNPSLLRDWNSGRMYNNIGWVVSIVLYIFI